MLTTIPNGLDEIIHTFGSLNDPKFEAKNIVLFDLPYPLFYAGTPVTRARSHRLLVENFQKAFKDLLLAGLDHEVKNYSGIYARRAIRGQSMHASAHSWGIAIDLEADKYPLGSNNRFPDAVVEIFHNAGFYYGGDFKSRHDPMHFQACTGY